MQYFKLLDIDLTLFDGEGGGDGGGEGSPQGSEGDVANPKGSEVVYGKQESDDSSTSNSDGSKNALNQDGQPAEKDAKALNAEFESFIKGDYKEAFDTRVKDIIDRRFKANKDLEKKYEGHDKLVEILAQKHKTDDIAKLTQLVEADIVESMAYESGLTPEQQQKILNAERIERQQEMQKQRSLEQQKIDQTIRGWQEQAKEMAAEYPDFNLRDAMQSDQFLGLLKANVPVKVAYELLNFDNLKAQIAKDAQSQQIQNIQAKQQRPKESAKNAKSVIVKSDVSKLTKADREEIARRAMHGENIRF